MKNKINQTVAGALAGQIHAELHKKRENENKSLEMKVKKDPLVLKAQSLRKQKDKLSKDIEKLERSIRDKYSLQNCYINPDSVSIRTWSDNGVATTSVLRSEIIIANHMEGVTYENMKTHILKKHIK